MHWQSAIEGMLGANGHPWCSFYERNVPLKKKSNPFGSEHDRRELYSSRNFRALDADCHLEGIYDRQRVSFTGAAGRRALAICVSLAARDPRNQSAHWTL